MTTKTEPMDVSLYVTDSEILPFTHYRTQADGGWIASHNNDDTTVHFELLLVDG